MLLETKGDGRCFLFAAARCLFGPHQAESEMRVAELRVRLVVEGLVNKDFYLDHYSLGIGLKEYSSSSTVPEMYATFSGVEEGLDTSDVALVYYNTMFKYRRKYSEAGMWQFHQLANILGAPVISIYPLYPANVSGGELMKNMRKLYHRVIYQDDPGRSAAVIAIMWCKSTEEVYSVNHFVTVVP